MQIAELKQRMCTFDLVNKSIIKVYALVNVLKHAFGETFPDDALVGLQFQLKSLSFDGNVDYEEFIRMFFSNDDSHASKA